MVLFLLFTLVLPVLGQWPGYPRLRTSAYVEPPGSSAGAHAGSAALEATSVVGPRAHPTGTGPVAPPGPAVSSGGWWNLSGSVVVSPGAREGAAVAYYPPSGEAILFGGFNGTFLSDTWVFASDRWTELTPAASPPARAWSGFAFDASDGYLLLFGGKGPVSLYNDAWEFFGGGWSRIPAASPPPARQSPQMAYDPTLGAVLLFGGEAPSGAALNDTWSFRSGGWGTRATPIGPSARWGGAFSDDPADRGCLLFGGANGTANSPFRDTWLFTAASGWRSLSPALSPSGRSGASAVVDPVGPSVLLFGGTNASSGTLVSDLWQYSNGTWAAIVTPREPPARSSAVLAWDSSDGYLLLFSGANATAELGDTWVLSSALGATLLANPLATDVKAPIEFEGNGSGGVGPYQYAFVSSFGINSPTGTARDWNVSFPSSGSVQVTVEVSDYVGESSTDAVTVTVYPLPTIRIVQSPGAVDANVPVAFAAVETGGLPPLSVYWEFGDGWTAGNGSPVHRYLAPGAFNASAHVRDSLDRNASATVSVDARPLPRATLSLTPATPSAGTEVDFRAQTTGGTGTVAVTWSFGDGGSATGTSVTHDFSSPGAYLVRASVADAIGGMTVSTLAVNVTGPSGTTTSSGPSPLVEGTAVALGLGLAVVAATLGVRSYRRGPPGGGPLGDPGLEPGEPAPEELGDAEILAGPGQEDDEP